MALGMSDGMAVGFAVGLSDGMALGMSDGMAVGFAVGLSDGMAGWHGGWVRCRVERRHGTGMSMAWRLGSLSG